MSVVKKPKVSKFKFGQIVIGPPGSGKTTYCNEMNTFYNEKLNRKSAVINLDPGNENMMYKPVIDIMELVTVKDVMVHMDLGPNGALMYCMEYLEKNIDWLIVKLDELKDTYMIFDLPGQVELYTHHTSIKQIFEVLENKDYHLCVVHMVDSHYCSDPPKFISTLLMSLSTMMQIGLPHINILSKADQLKKHSEELHFGIDFYTEVLNLDYLLDVLSENVFMSKYTKLNKALIEMIQDYSLVTFILLDIKNEKHLLEVKNAVDKANGYVYGAREERSIQSLLSCAIGARTESERYNMDDMQ